MNQPAPTLTGDLTDDMTYLERWHVENYEQAIAGIPDSFDGLHLDATHVPTDPKDLAAQAAFLKHAPGMLDDWWTAIDTLDGLGFSYGGQSETRAFALYFAQQVDAWFTARLDLLLAIAATYTDDRVPRPDHHGGGEIESSNRPIGHYRFNHITGLA